MLNGFYSLHDVPPRCDSPAFVPAPLPIRRPNTRKAPLKQSQAADPPHASSSTLYPPPPLLADPDDVIQSLCRFCGVVAPTPVPASQLSRTHDLALLADIPSTIPTHVLAIYDTPSPDPRALVTLIPVDLDHLRRRMRPDLFSRTHPVPSPTRDRPGNSRMITVPVLPMHVPHAFSAPLVLLFALGARSDTTDLVSVLLPYPAVEEGSTVPAAARAMNACCDSGELARRTTFNQGAWKNVLAFGPQDERIVGAVQFVWNVTSEARKIATTSTNRERR